MKDKNRARCKARQRAAKLKEIRETAAAFRRDIANQGVKLRPGTTDEQIFKAQERVEKEMFKESIGMSIISMAYVLHDKYEYGNKRLWDLIPFIARIITAVGNEERSLGQLSEEFESSANMNYGDIINDKFDAMMAARNICLSNDEALSQLVGGMLYRIKFVAVLPLYVMYFYCGWKERKLKNLVNAMGDVIADILLSQPDDARNRFEFTQLNYYTNKLEKSCKLTFDKYGAVTNLKCDL